MREKRNGLRPIILKIGDGRGNMVEHKKGYFHCFVTTGTQEEELYATAIVEMEDGTVSEWGAVDIQFDDIS
ncbi:hypothetical protein [Clostridium botulinum]|uniref:hypothetical protein n=1 Tax=Clostridium botulinum TaxID=1491 RepID=UPI0005F923DB|nr:hypothetical protein [Clostridium botulinum]APQ78686.1 hypothetical protein RSJ10_3922 [Clostridium botulinum]MBN3355967.1 hypothetical protein [Clostridium botulinum]